MFPVDISNRSLKLILFSFKISYFNGNHIFIKEENIILRAICQRRDVVNNMCLRI